MQKHLSEKLGLIKQVCGLENKVRTLQNQVLLAKRNKEEILTKYQSSKELTEVILAEFDKGYQFAKIKIKD